MRNSFFFASARSVFLSTRSVFLIVTTGATLFLASCGGGGSSSGTSPDPDPGPTSVVLGGSAVKGAAKRC